MTSASIELKPLSPGPPPTHLPRHRQCRGEATSTITFQIALSFFFSLFLSFGYGFHPPSCSSLMLTNQYLHAVFLFCQHIAHESQWVQFSDCQAYDMWVFWSCKCFCVVVRGRVNVWVTVIEPSRGLTTSVIVLGQFYFVQSKKRRNVVWYLFVVHSDEYGMCWFNQGQKVIVQTHREGTKSDVTLRYWCKRKSIFFELCNTWLITFCDKQKCHVSVTVLFHFFFFFLLGALTFSS